MCRPSYYLSIHEKNCGHLVGVWCTCIKIRTEDATKHMGNQPKNEKGRMLRPANAAGGNSSTNAPSTSRGMDATSDRNSLDRGISRAIFDGEPGDTVTDGGDQSYIEAYRVLVDYIGQAERLIAALKDDHD